MSATDRPDSDAPAASEDLPTGERLAREGVGPAEALDALLAAERFAFEEALCPVADEEAARSMARRIVTEVRREEGARRRAASARPQGRARRRLAYILAGSLAAHVVLLAFLAFQDGGEIRPDEAARAVAWDYVPPPLAEDLAGPDSEAALAEQLRASGLDAREVGEHLDRFVVEDGPVALRGPLLPGESGPADPLESAEDPLGTQLGAAARMRLIQGDEALKIRRLRAFDRDPGRTLTAMRRGLSWLASRQFADGRFEGGETTADQVTARALLAFLGDGHRSARVHTRPHDAVVRRGVQWLRGRLFTSTGLPRETLPLKSLGLGLAVLSEDFVLSHADLPLADTRERAREITALSDRIRGLKAAQATQTEHAMWSLWALDAAARTGLIQGRPEDGARLDRWMAATLPAEAAPRAADPARRAFEVLSQGTALRYAERSGERPRFKDWRRATVDDLLAAFLPNGKAKSGDPVEQTTLLLLALQTGYRPF